jgi:hypothetical protein
MDIDTFINEQINNRKNFNGVLISLDIVNSSKLKGNDEEKERTKSNLKQFIDSLIVDLPMAILNWSGDGGILIYDAESGYDDAVFLCDELIHLIPFFNKARGDYNALKESYINLRVVLHSGTLVKPEDPSTYHADELNIVAKYEREVGVLNHITITDDIYQKLNDNLKLRFESHPNGQNEHFGRCYILDYCESITMVKYSRN